MKAAWYLSSYMMIHERFYNVYILGGKCAPYMVSTWHVAPCHGYMAIHKFGFFADVYVSDLPKEEWSWAQKAVPIKVIVMNPWSRSEIHRV